MIVPVILSGGAGTRLWPLSRELYPKQFLPLAGARTMLQETLLRLQGCADLAAPLIVCNDNHRFLVAEQLRSIDQVPADIILEPVGRNTAPAVAVAALRALAENDDPLLLVLPADHLVRDAATLRSRIDTAAAIAGSGRLVTFGIVPSAAETGYGYIRRGEVLGEGVYAVARFVEKPDRTTAEAYIASGEYFWNSGMFVFRARRYLEELERFSPEIPNCCRQALNQARRDLDFLRLEPAAFSRCPSDSVDYAVMEKTASAAVIPLNVGWSDVGSWSALWEVGERDGAGNVLSGDVLTSGVTDSYIHADSRLVAAVGVEGCVIVETADAVLVASKEHVQQVKEIVQLLKTDSRQEAALHRRVSRPWGAYECIDQAERFQVKRITVNPGASLSRQMHHHRAEHWVVVKGTARITRGDEVFTLSENQSTYIPLGVVHRLENPGKIPLEIIEIQSGSYLGEDDIVRVEDNYGRTGGES